jgi:catabolite regulation protein CreA
MTDLTEFVPELIEKPTIRENLTVEVEKDETRTIIKSGCTFEDARSFAIQCRKTHPNEIVGWFKGANNTYVVFREDK